MIRSEAELVASKIKEEGFEYTFLDYDDFKQIKDDEFHRLIKDYLDSINKLKSYIYSCLDLPLTDR
jgi:predicted signal transduction protein with EAL and GGDEF domain